MTGEDAFVANGSVYVPPVICAACCKNAESDAPAHTHNTTTTELSENPDVRVDQVCGGLCSRVCVCASLPKQQASIGALNRWLAKTAFIIPRYCEPSSAEQLTTSTYSGEHIAS